MKHIKIEAKKAGIGYDIRVIEQTHKGEDFGNGVDHFEASNRFTLYSISYPMVGSSENCLFLQGMMSSSDNNVLYVTKDYLEKITQAVKEYNETYKALG